MNSRGSAITIGSAPGPFIDEGGEEQIMVRIETSLTATMPAPAEVQQRPDLLPPEAVQPIPRVDGDGVRKMASEDDRQLLQDAVKQLNKTLSAFDIQARFSIDDRVNEVVVKIYNTRTDEVIRQIPPEYALELAASLREKIGLFLDEKI